MSDLALGIDVSRYNGLVNWRVVAEHGVMFAGMRATISWAYRDPFFMANLDGALTYGVFPLPYHVLYPGENVGRQAENFLQAVGAAGWAVAWPVLDIELFHNQTDSTITNAIIDFSQFVRGGSGKTPLLYSTASFVNEHTSPGLWRADYQWWLAHYLADRTKEKPAPPHKPAGVSTWLIHQNSDKMPAWPGLQSGGIGTIDVNRWNGSAEDVRRFFGQAEGQPELITCPQCGYQWRDGA